MRVETLLSPGLLSNGIRLRIEAAKAISSVEVTAGRTPGGRTQAAATLAAFFTGCAATLSALADSVLPTVSTRTRNSATQATVVFSETLDATVVPAAAAFAVSVGTITGVAVSGSSVVLSGTGIGSGATVTYTKPATNALRDRAGNQVASFSGALA